MNTAAIPGAELKAQQSASSILHGVLMEAMEAYPASFTSVSFAHEATTFRRTYPELLTEFEAARLASKDRYAIARLLATASQRHLVWHDEDGSRSLTEALVEPCAPLPLEAQTSNCAPGWKPSLVYRGERWETDSIETFASHLAGRNVISSGAQNALSWLHNNLLAQGAVNLSGHKIVVLGANAEMASTRHWLEAGADVLALDITPPPEDWLASVAGRLSWPRDGANLLTQPREILATIREFAGDDPVHLALYAYAPGQAREMRLTGAMNAIVEAMPSDSIASVTILVSPTTPTALDQDDLRAMDTRREHAPWWESGLRTLGLLGHGDGAIRSGHAAATRTVVDIQGASYQAAQYLGKVIAAEAWTSGLAGKTPLRVSANTAAITRTRSLAHPVFAAAFGGAAALGVETFTPRMSRTVNGLLAIHDWLNPALPVPARIRVHGGIHTLPYPLVSGLRVAAAIGFARSPRLLRGLISS